MAYDEIAGEISPSIYGACDYFGADGHSLACVFCDHHLRSHALGAWPEPWRAEEEKRRADAEATS